MKVFLAGETPMSKDEGWGRDVEGWQTGALAGIIKRRLYSYYYHGFKRGNRIDKEVMISIEAGMELFLDSGAYSAHTQGESIDVEQYAAYIQEHGHHFTLRANLDDIGDTGPKSWDNLKALESLGCTHDKDLGVFPVFHAADDFAYLTKMLDGGYPFMALGGLVGASRNVLREWLDNVWAKYLVKDDGTPRIQVHGFGLTDTELMIRYPWFSVDSSSWVMTGIFGGCIFREGSMFYKVSFSDESPNKYEVNSWHYDRLTPPQQKRVDAWLKHHDVTAQQLSSHYSFRHLVNARTFTEIEEMETTPTFTLAQETLF
jgi:hypothetical protein